jgi:hypothetical protein
MGIVLGYPVRAWLGGARQTRMFCGQLSEALYRLSVKPFGPVGEAR